MAKSKSKNAFYAQSGGVTAVINASACGVLETARKYPNKIAKVYAGRNGIIGALTEDLIDTSKESVAAIQRLRHTPSGAFGSCRYKLKSLEQNRREYERLIEVFKAHDIGYFFYNGGGDSADTCLKISQLSETMGYPIQAIHMPKTVDNDLPITDNCPGFGSVAKYIACPRARRRSMSPRCTKTSTKGVHPRSHGPARRLDRGRRWLAHPGYRNSNRILFPEVAFDRPSFGKVDANVKQFSCHRGGVGGRKSPDGKFLADQGLRTPSAMRSSAVSRRS